MKAIGVAVAAVLLLSGCSQENAPADEVTKAAEEIVDTAAGEGTPKPVEGKYAPRDECAKIAGADVFRQRLALAVEARDAEGVAVLAAKDIKLDFGSGSGRAELIKRLEDPKGNLWAELEQLLALGCAQNSQGGITLPWYFAQEIPLDSFNAMIVTGEAVPLFAAPDSNSDEVATLNWDAVELVDGLDSGQPYQHVTFGEKEGYVATGQLRSVLDYRLTASSRNDRWRATSFVAGD